MFSESKAQRNPSISKKYNDTSMYWFKYTRAKLTTCPSAQNKSHLSFLPIFCMSNFSERAEIYFFIILIPIKYYSICCNAIIIIGGTYICPQTSCHNGFGLALEINCFLPEQCCFKFKLVVTHWLYYQ